MIVLQDYSEFRQQHSRCVATIGKFDGVHRGHQAILDQLDDKARGLNVPGLVILIEPHPEEFFTADPELCPARLTTLEEKLEILRGLQIDFVYLLRFDRPLSQLSAEEYITRILVEGLGIAAIIIGGDFRFGHRRGGDFGMLQEFGRRHDFEVLETATCEVDGRRVSSTFVRERLEAGDFELVERLLGRPYAISGEVVEGRRLGTDLGFPTCNVNLHRRRIPLHGVFACEVNLDGRLIPAAVNIGYRPTVTDHGEALLEAHLLDFSGDLYGRRLEVIFRCKLREEEKYDSLAALKNQIGIDVDRVRELFDG